MANGPAIALRHLGHTGGGEAHTRFAATGLPDELPVERMPEPVQAFLRYWNACRGQARMPDYRAIDPVDIPRLLPYLMLWTTSTENGGLRFECRLAGSEVEGPRRVKLTGRTLDDLNGRNAGPSRAEFESVALNGVPQYVERTADWIELPFVYYCRLLLPLARPGTELGDLVSVLTFELP